MTRKATWLVVLTIIVLISLPACSAASGPALTPTPIGAYPVAPEFRNLYENLGGLSVLGPAISPTFRHELMTCQYLESGLFCFNPQASLEADRVFLVPLGSMLTNPVPGFEPKIYAGFTEMYYRLYGTHFVGAPLTEGRVNIEKRRIEQYFEKLGFYQLMDDPRGVVHLMSYGSYFCRERCPYKPFASSSITGWNMGVDVPGLPSLNRLGGIKVFGNPITYPYTAADKSVEQLFERALVYIPADNPATIRLRPLSAMLNMPRTAVEEKPAIPTDGFVFYPAQGRLGFEVPGPFNEFLITHGGSEISGKPIGAVHRQFLADGTEVARQCFENFCLIYDPHQPLDGRVYLAELGSDYQKKTGGGNDPVQGFSLKNTVLSVAESKRQLTSNELQVIEVMVLQARDRAPVADIDSLLVIGMPDGSKPSYIIPPTGLEGKARLTLPPFTNAANGSVIPYVICLIVPSEDRICQHGSFLIWNK